MRFVRPKRRVAVESLSRVGPRAPPPGKPAGPLTGLHVSSNRGAHLAVDLSRRSESD